MYSHPTLFVALNILARLARVQGIHDRVSSRLFMIGVVPNRVSWLVGFFVVGGWFVSLLLAWVSLILLVVFVTYVCLSEWILPG